MLDERGIGLTDTIGFLWRADGITQSLPLAVLMKWLAHMRAA